MHKYKSNLCLLITLLVPTTGFAQKIDSIATELIQEATTDPKFLTDWVAELPEHDTVPSPRDVLGYTIGTPGKLTHVDDIHRYFRALADASPRVVLFSLGKSQEGREMLMAAVADEQTLARLEDYKGFTNQLADPRQLDPEAAATIIEQAKPMYWIVAGLHAAELGPPEMVMELAYRLAVEEGEPFDAIRGEVITLITPVLETDGRARQVEWYFRHIDQHTDYFDTPPKSPPFWGHYTRHDNNRDGLTMSQPLSRNFAEAFYDWKPTLSLDLHESVPFLYVSTGTGPYNARIDPITITEWQAIANYEVSRLTAKGLPAVWTWGFYTGWYPGYLLWVQNNHNASGRFFETFGNGTAHTVERDLSRIEMAGKKVTDRTWYRSSPPPKKVTWSMRNNINYMQTGVLASLEMLANNPKLFLENFYQKGVNGLTRAVESAPYAFVIPQEQSDRNAARDLLSILRRHRIEMHVAAKRHILPKDKEVRRGDVVILLNQLYGSLAQNLLEKQKFPKNVTVPPYDDVAWTLGLNMGVNVTPINDRDILDIETGPVPGDVFAPDNVITGRGQFLIVNHAGQNEIGPLRFALRNVPVYAAEQDFKVGGRSFNAGSLIIDSSGADRDDIKEMLRERSLSAYSSRRMPDVDTHELDLPRVALFQSWTSTQNAGWARYSLDQSHVPYSLISKDRVRLGDLLAEFDVIVVPSFGRRSDFARIVGGIDEKWSPLAYTKTAEYPSHGVIDSSEDITGGIGFVGMAAIESFVQHGGTLIGLHSGSILATSSGITHDISTNVAPGLNIPGSILSTKVLQRHPLTWGYAERTHVFRTNGPLFRVADENRHLVLMQFGNKEVPETSNDDEDALDETDSDGKGKDKKPPLVLSGAILDGTNVVDGAPALLHTTVGQGNVIIFGWNPLHRNANHHDHAFFYNAVLNWNDLPVPKRP